MAQGTMNAVSAAAVISTLLLLTTLCCTATTATVGEDTAAVAAGAGAAAGKVWVVGGDKGWIFGVSGWPDAVRVRAGDVLVFKYDKEKHNVVEVDEASYDACRAPAAGADTTARASGDDLVRLAGDRAFYISSVPGDCERGVKAAVGGGRNEPTWFHIRVCVKSCFKTCIYNPQQLALH